MKKTIKTVAAISVATVGTIHVINKIIFSMHAVSDSIYNDNTHDYEWRFGKVHYRKKGSGSPLLLIHNLTPGSSSYEFHAIIDALSEKYEVYAIDLLGYGDSEKINMTYTNYLYVQLITDFIKTVIGKKTSILTSGDSSSIAIMTCHNDPELINQLYFINPQSLFRANQVPTKQTKLLKLMIDCPIIGTLIYNIQTSKRSFEKKWREQYFYDADKIKEEDIEAYCKAAHRNNYKVKYTFSSYLGRYMNSNVIHALKEINNNMIFFFGNTVPDYETIAENYSYYNQSIETVILEDEKYIPHLENPEEFLKTASSYMNI